MRSLTILGGGNTAFAVAANLSLRGFEITLCEFPSFESTIEPIRERRLIHLDGVAERGESRIAQITTDIRQALRSNDLIFLIVPAYAHKPFAEACAPHLRHGHILTLLPGTLGSLEVAKILADAGNPIDKSGVVLAETDTAPYVCRKTAPDAAHIWGVVSGLGLGVLPATETVKVMATLHDIFTIDGKNGSPSAVYAHPNVLACGLSAMNPVVHPAGVLMNAGRIEYSRGDFYFYEEGVSPSVCKVIEAVDAERLVIGKALGFDLLPVHEAFHNAGFGPKGDLWSTINGSRMLTQLRAPGSMNTRWLSEDVPYGLATWASIGDQLGVETPIMDSLVKLGMTMMGDSTARSSRELGLAGMSIDRMLKYVGGGQ